MTAGVRVAQSLIMDRRRAADEASERACPRPVEGGTVTWACAPGFPPAAIFPFTPPERFGMRSLYEFQVLMFRPLYWLGRDGEPTVDYDLSLAEPPEWSADGRTVTITVKPWRWSNGETVCADNVVFWVNMLKVKAPRYGAYVPGYFPDNLTDYRKLDARRVSFTFDQVYSRKWVLLNQLTMITPMPRAWDRTEDGPADASTDLADVARVYEYLMSENGGMVDEDNTHRTRWADSPVWSVVNGPWRLRSYTLDGEVTFVPNEHYSGPNKPHLDEFRQIPTTSDEQEYRRLQAGPDGRDAIQVGFLPLSLGERSPDTPRGRGADPLAEHYTLVPQTAFCIRFMALNFNNPTVAGRLIHRPYIRQALQSTLDQDSAVHDIYQGHGFRQNGPVPVMPPSELVSPRQRGAAWPWPFDIERARSLLADNGWDVSSTPSVCVRPGNGPGEAGDGIPAGTKLSFSLRYAQGRPALTRLMARYQKDAASAGIELRLQEVYASTLVAEDGPGEPSADNPCRWELSCWNGGWVYNHPTGENLFQSGAGCNFSNYSDRRADELIASTVRTDDLDALDEYQDYIAEQVPVVFTPNFPLRLFEVANSLRGFEPINPFGLINPENWYYVEQR